MTARLDALLYRAANAAFATPTRIATLIALCTALGCLEI